MESFAAFRSRIASFQADSVHADGVLELRGSLRDKVEPVTGGFVPFFGNTTAWFLDPDALALVEKATDALHDVLGDALAQRLPLDLAHVTLHDLRASSDLAAVASEVFSDTGRLPELIARARAVGPVEVEFTWAYNSVNMSVVAGIQGASADDHDRLMAAHEVFEDVVRLGTLTPHVTLAYYRPDPPVPLVPSVLADVLGTVTATLAGRRFRLDPGRLHVLHFDSMANYWPVG